jgi:hypothetical protein
MKYIILIILVVILGCQANQTSQKSSVDKDKTDCFKYPKSIDSLNLRDMYDSARWYVFTWHCDEYYKSKMDTSQFITFGELPLKFRELNLRGDTVDIVFDFIDKNENSPILPSMTRDTKELSTGVGFSMKTKAKLYMLSLSGYTSVIKGGANRYENPLQPDVLKFIRCNWDRLDECFRRLAEHKRVKE